MGQVQGEAARLAGEPSGEREEASSEGLGGQHRLAQADARCPAGQQLSPAEVHGQLDRVMEQLLKPFPPVAELLVGAVLAEQHDKWAEPRHKGESGGTKFAQRLLRKPVCAGTAVAAAIAIYAVAGALTSVDQRLSRKADRGWRHHWKSYQTI